MLEELVEHIGTCRIHVPPEPLDPLVVDALPSNEGSTTRASIGYHEGSNSCVFQTFIRSHSGRYTILPSTIYEGFRHRGCTVVGGYFQEDTQSRVSINPTVDDKAPSEDK